jgi:hypothetical protein
VTYKYKKNNTEVEYFFNLLGKASGRQCCGFRQLSPDLNPAFQIIQIQVLMIWI